MFKVLYDYTFERDLPKENKTTKGTQTKHLELGAYYDCLTARDIERTMLYVENAEKPEGGNYCDADPDGGPASSTIRFYQAFYPIVVLGPDQNASRVRLHSKAHLANQKHDLLLKYECGDQQSDGEWFVYSSRGATAVEPAFFKSIEIDVHSPTCEPLPGESKRLFDAIMGEDGTREDNRTLFGMLDGTLPKPGQTNRTAG